MCIKDFQAFMCGHCAPPYLAKCPLAAANSAYPLCGLPAERPWPTNTLCHACSREVHNKMVMKAEEEHKARHTSGDVCCDTVFKEEGMQSVAGGNTQEQQGNGYENRNHMQSGGDMRSGSGMYAMGNHQDTSREAVMNGIGHGEQVREHAVNEYGGATGFGGFNIYQNGRQQQSFDNAAMDGRGQGQGQDGRGRRDRGRGSVRTGVQTMHPNMIQQEPLGDTNMTASETRAAWDRQAVRLAYEYTLYQYGYLCNAGSNGEYIQREGPQGQPRAAGHQGRQHMGYAQPFAQAGQAGFQGQQYGQPTQYGQSLGPGTTCGIPPYRVEYLLGPRDPMGAARGHTVEAMRWNPDGMTRDGFAVSVSAEVNRELPAGVDRDDMQYVGYIIPNQQASEHQQGAQDDGSNGITRSASISTLTRDILDEEFADPPEIAQYYRPRGTTSRSSSVPPQPLGMPQEDQEYDAEDEQDQESVNDDPGYISNDQNRRRSF